MARIRSKNTVPEQIVRSAIHRAGYRFRLHPSDLPGKPDLVLPSRRIAVFVHGCFWHQHSCREGRVPSSNSAYWAPKLARNVARDAAAQTALAEHGWRCIVIWDCESAAGIQALLRLLARSREKGSRL